MFIELKDMHRTHAWAGRQVLTTRDGMLASTERLQPRSADGAFARSLAG